MKYLLRELYHYFYPRDTDHFIKLIKKQFNPSTISTIFDIGSRDGEQSIELSRKFPNAKIYAFECNPDSLSICKTNLENYPQITLVEKAVNTYDGKCSFFKTVANPNKVDIPKSYKGKEKLYISGTSSLYGTETNPSQQKINVECITLKTFCDQNKIKVVDLLWIDLEGAELKALRSLEERIKTVKMLQVEAQLRSNNPEVCTFFEINDYLQQFDFDFLDKKRVEKNIYDQEGFSDVIFLNTSLR